jgi:hypothetical protein
MSQKSSLKQSARSVRQVLTAYKTKKLLMVKSVSSESPIENADVIPKFHEHTTAHCCADAANDSIR